MKLMRRYLIPTTIVLISLVTPQHSLAIGPKLEVDCGNWNKLSDAKGVYKELSAVAFYSFSGAKFKYEVRFFNTSKGNSSRGTFKGTYEIENPEYSNRQIELPIPMKFRNNSTNRTMFNSKYIRAEFKFTDIQGFEAYSTCIWKWN
jgi:hypothetical protein